MKIFLRIAILFIFIVGLAACGSEDTGGTGNQDNQWTFNDDEDPDAGLEDADPGDAGEVDADVDADPGSCDDGEQSGDQTDIDCGGSCEPCEEGQGCQIDADCDTDHCRGDVCIAPRAELGAECERDFECLSEQCDFIGEDKFCTESCETTCSEAGVACYEGLCTPVDYCDDDSGFGNGPGCEGAPCDQCHDDATCSQSGDSFVCICRDGFEGDGILCQDIDECAEGIDSCDELATCTNTPGSYECECPEGYEGDGTYCEDVDECAEGIDSCDELATCTNTPGSYECECPDGYTGDGHTCEDINECTSGAHSCSQNATCTNTPGSYECECNEGYEGDGHSCTDINECAEGTHSCDDNAMCVNYPGGYSCACYQGYEGDGHSCTDIDECAEGIDSCHSNAFCTNTEGSYYCTCEPGFVGNGYSCDDIDECAQGTDSCDDNATCTNTPGSYECECIDGYTGDGHSCLMDGNICENPLVVESLPYVHAGDTTDATNDYHLEAGWCPELQSYGSGAGSNDHVHSFTPTETAHYRLELESSFDAVMYLVTDCEDLESSCVAGIDQVYSAGTEVADLELEGGTTYFIVVDGWGNTTNMSGTYELTIDYNQCLNGTDSCTGSSECVKEGDTYECACSDGYEFDGVECVDIDECAEGTHSCDDNATCTNTPGSYECECIDPYEGDGYTCVDEAVLGESCINPFVVTEPLTFSVDGSTDDAHNLMSFGAGDCPGISGGRGGSAPDQVHVYAPSADGNYRITVESNFDPVLYVVTDCDDISNTCLGASDAAAVGLDEVLELELMAGTSYFIVVDGWSTSSGDYTLIVEEMEDEEEQ